MTSIINLPLNGQLKKVHLVYDFNQVSDVILMVSYNDKTKGWEKTFLNYNHGSWVTDRLSGCTYIDALRSNKKFKRFLFYRNEMSKQYNLIEKQLLTEHVMLLFNVCS